MGVALAQLRLLVAGREFRYLGRCGSLAEYRREPVVDVRARAGNAAAQLAQLGCFARTLTVKAALTTGITPLARALGARGWPY